MAALVCDICGGKLVMGAGGIATCESCGMEYSTERVREKVQAIKGSVQIDNSNMVDTWMKMATDAATAGNNKEAYDYYAKVLEVEPSNWRAIFGKGKAAAWQSTLANSRTPELYQAVKAAIPIIESSDMSAEEIISTKNEFAVAIYNVNNAFLSLRQENFDRHDDKYYDLHFDEWWEAHYTQATANVSQTEDVISLIADLDDDLSKSNVLEMKKHICEVLVYICSCQDAYWDSYSKNYLQSFGIFAEQKKDYVDKYVNLVMEIREIEPDFRTSKYSQIDPWDPPTKWDYNRHDKLLQYWQQQEQEMKAKREKEKAKKRFEDYWKEHADEKKGYEARLQEIDAEIKGIQEQLKPFDMQIADIQKGLSAPVPADEQMKTIKDQQEELNSQKSKLGIFAGKQKKELQAKIDELQLQLPDIQETIDQQRAAIKQDVDAKIEAVNEEAKPLREQVATLEKEKQDINSELTKAR